MKFPLSAAAAQVENFESLNEGIWITEAALTNMEAAFAGNAATVASQLTQITELQAQLKAANEATATAQASLTTANETLAAKEERIQQLVKEKEEGVEEFENPTREKDPLGGKKVTAFHKSADNPANQLADQLLGTPVEKKD